MKKPVLEILKKAIVTEIEGQKYFNYFASRVLDIKGKKMFEQLAKDEIEHMKVVEALYITFKDEERWLNYEDALKSDKIYEIEGLPQKGINIFPDEKKLNEMIGSHPKDVNVVEAAVDIEAKAENIYLKILEKVSDPQAVEVVKKLADMEAGHKKLLEWEFDSLSNAGFWLDYMEFDVEGGI